MKTLYISALLFFAPMFLFGQNKIKPDTGKHVAKLDTINPNKGDVKGQLKAITEKKVRLHSDTIGSDSVSNQPKKSVRVDTAVQNKYGDLLKDDSATNRKYSLLVPAVEVVSENAALSLTDQYIFKLQFSKISLQSWKRTLNAGWPWGPGWIWDQDRFGNNFLSHPIMGNFYYNSSRANGYNFAVSTAFTFAGSYMWKIFGENGKPEREDIINTTADGIMLGEILYRLSSNILDDRTTGANRVFREILAGIIDPIRGVNRLFQGKCSRRTNKEVYNKEPLNITFEGGLHQINNDANTKLGKGAIDEMINTQLDYGNPFEMRTRTPYAFFKVRGEFNFGAGRKIVDNITGYGILFGENLQGGKLALLAGGFQYYDYWDKRTLELSTIAFGFGIFSKYTASKSILLYTNLHVAGVPLAGNSIANITDTSQSRDYSFGYGWEAKAECNLVLGNYVTIGAAYNYFIIHCFNNGGKDQSLTNTLGNNTIGIFKPVIKLHIYKSINIGYEHNFFTSKHVENEQTTIYPLRTEQKLFLIIYLEDAQRRGHYN
jgi:hypothetical protein